MDTVAPDVSLHGAFTLVAAGSPPTLTNGLVAYYPFNGNANDASGNGQTGTNEGGFFVPNRFGNALGALFFENTNNTTAPESLLRSVQVPATALNSLTAGTISAWIRPNAVTYGAIIAKHHSGANSIGAFTLGGSADGGTGLPVAGTPGTLYFHPRNGMTVAQSTTTVEVGVWQQVLVVFTASNCVFYVNGQPAGSTAGDYSIPNDLSDQAETRIGAFGKGFVDLAAVRPQQWLHGAMDDVRIYNRALSPAEVAQLHASEAGLSVFQVVAGPWTWNQAKADAAARGGRLAVLNTQAKIDQVNAQLTASGTWPNLLIGLTQRCPVKVCQSEA